MEKTRVHYVDDKEDEAERIKVVLESSGRLDVSIEFPPPDIGAALPSDLPELFLIDYLLDAMQEQDRHANYTGSTLSAAIRDQAPDHPIALISKKSIVNARKRQALQSDLPIDRIFYKAEVTKDPTQVITEMESLASGFQCLRHLPYDQRDWSSLLGALQASSEESDLLRKAAPPLRVSVEQGKSTWRVSELADWVQSTLLAYPGILFDPMFSATELRIDVTGFLLSEVQDLFTEARYTGVFAPPEGRWWRERLWRIAMEYVEDRDFADLFALAFRECTGIELAPAVSIVGGEVPADTVCYIYHQPVMYKYTLAYRPDNRPPVMDPARVSYKAIQQSNEVQIALVEGAGDELVNRIRAMEL